MITVPNDVATLNRLLTLTNVTAAHLCPKVKHNRQTGLFLTELASTLATQVDEVYQLLVFDKHSRCMYDEKSDSAVITDQTLGHNCLTTWASEAAEILEKLIDKNAHIVYRHLSLKTLKKWHKMAAGIAGLAQALCFCELHCIRLTIVSNTDLNEYLEE